MESKEQRFEASPNDPPPFLGQWPRVYVAVLGYLLLLIVALYVVSRIFTY
jgi:hypothetical protein